MYIPLVVSNESPGELEPGGEICLQYAIPVSTYMCINIDKYINIYMGIYIYAILI